MAIYFTRRLLNWTIRSLLVYMQLQELLMTAFVTSYPGSALNLDEYLSWGTSIVMLAAITTAPLRKWYSTSA
ncbi:unnamed protein product [Gongylonema pulchrum]|uniref:Bestrophin homolog n=1 Tax=Gongylonema pulchrum TaxID=637853 RepID=A0A183DJX4_9BILA|nr:unnamed protein product [Gongylonema pulchrum]